MRHLGGKVVRRLPPVARRDRRITDLGTELQRLQGKNRWSEEERSRLEDRLQRSLRRVETFRELSERHERQKLRALKEKDQEAEGLRARIEDLEEDLERAHRYVEGPSFLTLLGAYRESYEQRFEHPAQDGLSMWQLPYKLRNYSLAQSHGVSVPKVYRVWSRSEDISLDAIPADQVVLKSDGGHSGYGVFILRREEDGWTTLDGTIKFRGETPAQKIRDRFEQWHGPYFAEELLESSSRSVVPEDIKVYTAYGKVLQILLMQASEDGSMHRKSFTRRYIGAQGEDLGKIAEMGTHHAGIPAPENLLKITETAEHLSRAVGMPFIRVDLYQTPHGLVLGELTPTPGGRQRYRQEHDASMGLEWIKAQVRLERDLAAGRPYGSLYGESEYTWWYEGLHESVEAKQVSGWARVHLPCAQWCY